MIPQLLFSFLLFSSVSALAAQEAAPPPPTEIKEMQKEATVTRTHTMSLGTSALEYESIAGSLTTKNQDDLKESANIYFTAYFVKKSAMEKGERPITFCFNGGPGSSAVWLHMGCMGPKMVKFKDLQENELPGSYIDNPYTLLTETDLVFVDPVSTGFSRPVDGVSAKEFHGVDEDINSLAEFIRLFLTRYDRWGAKKYLMGESYGTLRVVGLADKLQNDFFIDFSGLILISTILDFTTMDEYVLGNDLSYLLNLPTYSACAWFHKKLPPEYQNKKLQELLAEVEEFVQHDLCQALMLGDKLEAEQRLQLAKKISNYTSLSQDAILQMHLRLPGGRFMKELLRNEGKIIGRFDGRYTGYDTEAPVEYPSYDPSLYAVAGLFTSAFQNYMHDELGLKKEERYYIIGRGVQPWNYSQKNLAPGLGYLNVADALRSSMVKNPQLKVFCASGYMDNATPYFASDYTLDHLQLPQTLRKNIEQHYYEGGHMMYLNPAAHKQLKEALTSFYRDNSL